MTRTVWKFDLETVDEQTISVPKGAQFLSLQMQHGKPRIWALVDPNAREYPVDIRIAGTGHELPDSPGNFLGTFQLHDGGLVFHAFATDHLQ
jgi:hypothetical protein